MILLVTKAHPSIERLRRLVGPVVGRLLTPRHFSNVEAIDYPWAADNDCFNGFQERRYVAMLDALARATGRPLFVSVPDVVADSAATDQLWDVWAPRLVDRGLPAAYVMQDGCVSVRDVPADAAAVFVGGTTHYKLSESTARLIAAVKDRGMHVHMGRVNSLRRIRYAASVGCDSIDGTKWSRFTDTYLHQMQALAYEQVAMATGREQD